MKKLIVGTLALCLLAACGKKPETEAPAAGTVTDADVQSAAARETAEFERDMAAKEAASVKRALQYRGVLIPMVAGVYSGDCTQGAAMVPDAITVSAAGVASARQWQHDLMASKGMLTLGRTLEKGKPVAAYALADNKDPDWSMAIISGKEESALLGSGTNAIKCLPVAQAARLRDKPLYPAVASFFTAASGKLSCAGVGDLTRGTVDVKPGGTGVTVGERTFSFEQGVTGETASIDASGKALSFNVDYENGDKVAMTIDADGKLSDFMWAAKEKNLFCTPVQ